MLRNSWKEGKERSMFSWRLFVDRNADGDPAAVFDVAPTLLRLLEAIVC